MQPSSFQNVISYCEVDFLETFSYIKSSFYVDGDFLHELSTFFNLPITYTKFIGNPTVVRLTLNGGEGKKTQGILHVLRILLSLVFNILVVACNFNLAISETGCLTQSIELVKHRLQTNFNTKL